ncbi:hypothetical protein TL16_g10186 [Triparma laevis f. inornata]|uniref:Adenosine deaminase domain-containing protein n=1 Tax=Triparma laevis f. inornata TaxID=1714386 RepID=A0A9W7BFN7_9STRA|nr:hypothetical protein TL16_g10186 [Triparma laevis f. inornata]
MSLLLSVSKHMTLLNTKVTDLFGRLVHKRRFFFLLGSLSTLLLSSTLFLPTLKSTLLHSRIVKSLLMRRKAFTRSLYKIELHCHLTGSIRIETLNEFLREHGLQKYEPPKSLTLKNCFSAFPLVHSAIKTKENLRRLTFETLADLSYANCIYAEIRTTPRALNDINKAGYLETVIECFKEWEEGDSRLIPRLIVSVDRSKSLREAEENVDLAVEGFLSPTNKYIVGVDLGGNPSSGNFKSFIPVLNKARENGLKVTVHCGEVENEEEIDGVLEWGPDRLGHFLTCSDEQFQKGEKQFEERKATRWFHVTITGVIRLA